MSKQTIMWLAFNTVMAALLYIDLGILNKHSHKVSLKQAGAWVAVWVATALLFALGIGFELGQQKALEFLTGYIIEYSLSMDNLFVFVMIFAYFGTAPENQPRVLRWGILGAIVMRFIMIFAGVALLNEFKWMIYVFGAVLIYTAVKMFNSGGDDEIEPEKNPVFRLFKKTLPFDPEHKGEEFFVKKNGVWHATGLFAVVLMIEMSDVVFAIDSIPAILAISRDQFIVYTSNVFAILGLRALYFLLAGMMGMFCYLKYGISIILAFVGVKMLVSAFYHISVELSLAVVLGMLAVSIGASLLFGPKKE